jgi:peptide/nickel transport system ATP-binding protein
MEPILEIEGLTVHYHSDGQVVRAINDLSLSLGRGEVLGLVGETGAGKTTLALSTLDMVQAAQGEVVAGTIRFEGRDVRAMSGKEIQAIRGKEIAMIFQDPMTSLNPLITVGEQIAETVRQHEQCGREQSWARAAEILELVGIPAARAEEYPYQFSGGMKQRVVIAVALACNPRLLLADEPTTALDVTIQAQVLDMMNTLIRERQTSVLFITHDLGIVAENCAKVATMYAGEVVEYGTVEQVFGAPGHPYTLGLFNSLPDFDSDSERLRPIPGLMPDPTRLPEGCFFSPRCPRATDLCRSVHPADMVTDGHRIKCHYPNAAKEALP